DGTGIATRGEQGGLVHEVGQIGAGKAGCSACQHAWLDVGSQRHLAHVHLENLLATPDIGKRNHNLTVETARTQQGRVEHVGPVGGSNDQDPLASLETVHFDQQLVEGLLAFVVAATEASAPL